MAKRGLNKGLRRINAQHQNITRDTNIDLILQVVNITDLEQLLKTETQKPHGQHTEGNGIFHNVLHHIPGFHSKER